MRNRPRQTRVDLDLTVDQVDDPVDANTAPAIVDPLLAPIFPQRRIRNFDREPDGGGSWVTIEIGRPGSPRTIARSGNGS